MTKIDMDYKQQNLKNLLATFSRHINCKTGSFTPYLLQTS